MLKKLKPIHWIIISFGSISFLLVIGLTGWIIFSSYFTPFENEEAEDEEEQEELYEIDCDTIVLDDDWQIYSNSNGFGYTIKYPSNWQYSEELFNENSYWNVAFGPEGNISETAAVFIGEANYHTLESYQHLLSEGTSPPYMLGDNEETRIDGNDATKFILEQEGLEQYKFILYYVPYTHLGINRLFKGNTEQSIRKDYCEAEVFYTMLGSYTHGQEHTNDECSFSFKYPLSWEINKNFYYETAAGEKAQIPTIHLKAEDNKDSNDWIRLNPRQSDCFFVTSPTITTEYINGNEITIYSNESTGGHCIETEVEAKDINGNDTTYYWISFTDDEDIQNIFREIINTFETF